MMQLFLILHLHFKKQECTFLMEQTCIFRLTDSRTVEQRRFLEIDSNFFFLILERKKLGSKKISGPELRSQDQIVIEQSKKLDEFPSQGSCLSQILKYR